MKGSCTLVASMLAASTVALRSSSSSGDPDPTFVYPSSNEGLSSSSSAFSGKQRAPNSHLSSNKEQFAPRFDGLRFIETLVTAHR
ncbi:hypothetical protein I3843_11G108800 [Carya illinoinensis]|uniref:Secreted protein n=1 Tax=Carya illinoinensis TaxID=32201 RepID=A0A8T1P693_CARIL|nr:uncharacterized protein LOC122280656 [Carya illinoinensis]KAG2680641.1 hypothetical protein I3760_11G107800 [Carya illinoinensis]KAG6636417.1 hypothetical protein CIPAW_11G110100 [Carya illinoinensis]KAG6688144.1 hypothetical protein I3842_11G109400 [Carya illinoinensis]KAG7956113.1 hypothetical protein I3843_11G108800 [Carya illinoinensis]